MHDVKRRMFKEIWAQHDSANPMLTCLILILWTLHDILCVGDYAAVVGVGGDQMRRRNPFELPIDEEDTP